MILMAKSEKKILIVDDSTTNQVLLEAILEEEGYSAQTAFGAVEALKLMEKNQFDLVLLDLLMPQVSGFDFLKKIKENSAFANVPVVVVSAVGSPENEELVKSLGARSLFSKPIDIPLFLEEIKNVLA